MVKIYVRMIRAGKMMLEDVPEKWRDAVNEALGPQDGTEK